jgi:nitroreductase
MDVDEAVTSRQAVRGFTNQPVSKEVIERMLSAPVWAPSGSNLQPWNIYVVTGAPLAEHKHRAVEATTRQILIYGVLLVPISVLPWAFRFAGTMHGVVALACGAILIALALRLRKSTETDRQAAHRPFVFSISYLFVLFGALLVSSSGDRWSPVAPARVGPTNAASLQAESLARLVKAARCPISVWSDEV